MTELLVVLGILAVLLAVLVPALFSARAKAPTTQCAANLRQIGIALQSYVQDFDGVYPQTSQTIYTNGMGKSANDWSDLLAPYTGKPFPFCPNRVIPKLMAFPDDPTAPRYSGYAYNVRLNESLALNATQTINGGLPENAVRHPALTVAVFDCQVYVTGLPGPDTGDLGYGSSGETIVPGGKRHQKGGNYLFCDGHVKWYLPDAVQSSEEETPHEHADGIHPGFGL